jgi:hypothetical protein
MLQGLGEATEGTKQYWPIAVATVVLLLLSCCCAIPAALMSSEFASPDLVPVTPTPDQRTRGVTSPDPSTPPGSGYDGGCWEVTSPFGWRVSPRGFPNYEWHNGVDMVRCDGNTYHAPVAAFQDSGVFSIDFSPSVFQDCGQEVEIANDWSYEEIPILWTVCHLSPYRVEGQVLRCENEACTGTTPVPGVGVYLCRWFDDGHGPFCGDLIRQGQHGGQVWPCRDVFPYPVNPEGWTFPPTDAQGRWCYEVGLPAAFDVVIVKDTIPANLVLISPDRQPIDFPGEVTSDDQGRPRAQDGSANFYLLEPPEEPTPTPTPTPTPVAGEPGAAPAVTPPAAAMPPNGLPWIPEVMHRYPGWGPPLNFGAKVHAYTTVLGYLGDTGRQTGPHVHVEANFIGGWFDEWGQFHHYGSTVDRLNYYRPKYPDGSPVEDRYLALPYGRRYTSSVDPLQFLPHGGGDLGMRIVNLPPPGDPLAGEGMYWQPAALWDDNSGGGRYTWLWRWFQFLGYEQGCGSWFGSRCKGETGSRGSPRPGEAVPR